ncbi:MAG: hypothetical protein V2A74_06415 [bacterium]
MSREPYARFPLWLEFSGLPEFLNRKAGKLGWAVFKKIVELDCDRNAEPGTVEIALNDLAPRLGVKSEEIRRTVEKIRKAKALRLFLPENDEEEALFEVRQPLPCPILPEEVQRQRPHPGLGESAPLRYCKPASAALETEKPKVVEEIVDRYFSTIGLKMNSFILDELRVIAGRFSPERLRRAFDRAEKLEIRSLRWVVRELYKESGGHESRAKN